MDFILKLENALWSGPLLVLLMGSHLYFTVALKGVQKWTWRGIKLSLRPQRGETGVSSFGALATSLAAAIGTGNIVGIATAVALGGPGAVLWCWFTGVFGMATRYAESVLSLKHRRKEAGTVVGGPMYVLEDALHMPRMGRCFAFMGIAAAVGTGSLLQSNAVATTMQQAVGLPLWVSGIILTVCGGMVILGGVQSISNLCEKLVPAMSALYIAGCIWLLFANRTVLPETFRIILTGAFSPKAAGGGLVGFTIGTAAKYGVARGLFTNEAGMGTAPMAAVIAPAENAAEEALVSMTGVFWDTVVICAMTGLALVSSMLRAPEVFQGAQGSGLCYLAFSLIPGGGWILTVCLVVFAFATVVGWCWYGECCSRYLWGEKSVVIYRLCYLVGAFLGVFWGTESAWSLGGILAGLMAVPNLMSLLLLRKEIQASLKSLTKPSKQRSVK